MNFDCINISMKTHHIIALRHKNYDILNYNVNEALCELKYINLIRSKFDAALHLYIESRKLYICFVSILIFDLQESNILFQDKNFNILVFVSQFIQLNDTIIQICAQLELEFNYIIHKFLHEKSLINKYPIIIMNSTESDVQLSIIKSTVDYPFKELTISKEKMKNALFSFIKFNKSFNRQIFLSLLYYNLVKYKYFKSFDDEIKQIVYKHFYMIDLLGNPFDKHTFCSRLFDKALGSLCNFFDIVYLKGSYYIYMYSNIIVKIIIKLNHLYSRNDDFSVVACLFHLDFNRYKNLFQFTYTHFQFNKLVVMFIYKPNNPNVDQFLEIGRQPTTEIALDLN